MCKIKKILLAVIFVFTFSIIGKAQGTTSYRFLEVVDFANQPIVDATVKVQISCDGGDKKTNEAGRVERFPIGGGDCGSLNDFSISKDGYYPFRDIGLFSAPHNDVYRDQFVYSNFRNLDKYKIELLKIPQNKAEQKAIGNEEQKRELFWAVRDKDSAAVRKLLKSGISPNISTADLRGVWLAPENLPAIIYSAALGDIDTVGEFLQAGVNLRQKDSPASDILLYYLGANPRNYYIDYDTMTEKEKADLIKFQDGVDLLINAGANLNATTQKGKTALIIASKNGDLRTVKTLLDKNLSVDQPDSAGMTALIYATNFNYLQNPQNLEIVERLLKKGANQNLLTPDKYGGCTSALMNAAANSNSVLVKFLINNKADVNLTCADGRNALRAAIPESYGGTQDKYNILETLIGAGANVNAADSSGQTNLMFAVGTNDLNAVELLLKAGAADSVNACNKRGETALMKARRLTDTADNAIFRLLVKYGANPMKSVECQPF